MVLKAPQVGKEYAPEVPWASFLNGLHANWEVGHHLSALGRTGGGKTTCCVQILDAPRDVVVLLTKLTDPLFQKLRSRGYKLVTNIDDWPSREWHPKVAVHLPPSGLDRKSGEQQATLIRRVLHRVWRQGNSVLYLDEIAELTDLLNLKTEMRAMYKEARSAGVSIVAGTQRPAWVPKEMYSQPRFLLFWRTTDRNDQKAYAEMNGVDPEPIRAIVAQLAKFEILAVDTDNGELVRTRPPRLP